MKRKIWIVVLCCVVAVVIVTVCLFSWGARQGLSISLGQYADSGSGDATYVYGSILEDNIEVSFKTVTGHMVLLDGVPVCMSGREELFKALSTGDQVLIIHGSIAESYPGQSKAFLIIKYADGTEDDIPERNWVALKTSGWLSPATPINEEEAIMIANVYTWHCFDIVTAKQNPETGDWAVEMWSEDRENHETVYISADGQKVTVASGILYR